MGRSRAVLFSREHDGCHAQLISIAVYLVSARDCSRTKGNGTAPSHQFSVCCSLTLDLSSVFSHGNCKQDFSLHFLQSQTIMVSTYIQSMPKKLPVYNYQLVNVQLRKVLDDRSR